MYELQAGEKIKDIKGYEGSYAITNYGRVWSCRRNIWLSEFYVGHGYAAVRLCDNGIETDKKVHRLVAEAFIKNKDNKPQVNHINGDKKDNRVNNLHWVTARENIQHSCDLGLNPTLKLSFKDKITICKLFHFCNAKKAYIARLFGISSPGVIHVIKEYSSLVTTV